MGSVYNIDVPFPNDSGGVLLLPSNCFDWFLYLKEINNYLFKFFVKFAIILIFFIFPSLFR